MVEGQESWRSGPQRPRAVIVTAIPIEFKAVTEHLRNRREVIHSQGSVYGIGEFAGCEFSWEVSVVETGAGNVQAALELERAIGHFHPACVLFVGVAGGLKDVGLGDVVAATKVYAYEGGKAEDEFRPRPGQGESAYEMIQIARFVARNAEWTGRIQASEGGEPFPEPQALVGPIAAGEKVVASKASEVYDLLKKNYGDALAVEMEGYGFTRALHANRSLPGLVIRGISDLVDAKGEADARGSQPVAARRAAAFAFEVLARFQPTYPAGVGRAVAREDEPPAGVRVDAWRELVNVAADLYRRGPTDRGIWERAGGDVGCLALGATGRADWFAAVSELRRGGGGGGITADSLLTEMLLDYPGNSLLREIGELLGVSRGV